MKPLVLSAATLAAFDAAIVEATVDVFASYGLTLEPLDHSGEPDHELACCIGFTSTDIQGSFLMTSTKTVVVSAWPEEIAVPTASDVSIADWFGELANQVFGRARAALNPRGFAVSQGTPALIYGISLRRSRRQTTLARELSFVAPSGDLLRVYLDAVFAKPFELSATPDEGHLGPGEVSLF